MPPKAASVSSTVGQRPIPYIKRASCPACSGGPSIAHSSPCINRLVATSSGSKVKGTPAMRAGGQSTAVMTRMDNTGREMDRGDLYPSVLIVPAHDGHVLVGTT
jgi:hypothetical protein